jgi:hypothetical protein
MEESDNDGILLRRAEEKSLSLRKNKNDELLLNKRISNIINKDFRLHIKPESLNLPEIFLRNYERSIDKLEVLSKLLTDDDTNIKKFAIYNLRKIISKDKVEDTVISDILNKAYKNLVKILSNPLTDKYSFFEISWIIVDLLFNHSAIFLSELRNVDLLKRFNEILSDVNTDYLIVRQIFWILGNTIDNDVEMCKYISQYFEFNRHFYQWSLNLDFINKDFDGIIIWSFYVYIDNILEIKRRDEGMTSLSETFGIIVNCLNIFNKCILLENDEAISECLLLFKKIALYSDFHELLHNNKITPLIVVCLETTNNNLSNINKCIAIFSSLLSGTNDQADIMLQYPVLNKLVETLDGCVKKLKDTNILEPIIGDLIINTFLALSNMAACGSQHIEQIFNNNQIRVNMNYIFFNFGEFRIAYEILYFLYNCFVAGNLYIKAEFIQRNLHQFFCYHIGLKDDNCPAKIYCVVLDGIFEILDYGEKGSTKVNYIQRELENQSINDMISSLCLNKNQEVYLRASKIAQKFWGEDEFLYNGPGSLDI